MEQQQIENIIEESVFIKMDSVPEELVGFDLTWIDKEIKKIKDRLLNKLTAEKNGKANR